MAAVAGSSWASPHFLTALVATIVFGFVLEYVSWWVVLLILLPPPAIAFMGGAQRSSSGWGRGFVVGLA